MLCYIQEGKNLPLKGYSEPLLSPRGLFLSKLRCDRGWALLGREVAAGALDGADPLLELGAAGQVLGLGRVVVPRVHRHGVAAGSHVALAVVVVA